MVGLIGRVGQGVRITALVCILGFQGLCADALKVRTIDSDDLASDAESNSRNKSCPVFLEFVVDSDPRIKSCQVVVGQPVAYELRALYDPHCVEIRGISRPETDKPVIAEAAQEPIKSLVKRDGHSLQQLSWVGILYPKTEGPLEILPAQLDYIVRNERSNRGGWGVFSQFFASENIHSVSSKLLKIQVNPLPPTSQSACGVGFYKSCRVLVDRETVAQGDAVQIRYILEGEGSAGLLDIPELKVPSYCTASFAQYKRNKGSVELEYVLQVHQSGRTVLSEQRFVFFNPKERIYYSVLSPRVQLLVEPRAEVPTPASKALDYDEESDESEQFSGLNPAMLQGLYIAPFRRLEIPLVYLNLIALMMLLVSFSFFVWPWVNRGATHFMARWQRRRRARALRKRLKNRAASAPGLNLVEDLYAFFLPFSDELGRENVEWKDFWLMLQEVHFPGLNPVMYKEEGEQVLGLNPAFKADCERWLLRVEKMK